MHQNDFIFCSELIRWDPREIWHLLAITCTLIKESAFNTIGDLLVGGCSPPDTEMNLIIRNQKEFHIRSDMMVLLYYFMNCGRNDKERKVFTRKQKKSAPDKMAEDRRCMSTPIAIIGKVIQLKLSRAIFGKRHNEDVLWWCHIHV